MESFDVIVVGAGLAGLSAALAVRDAQPGAHVALLCKHGLEESLGSASAHLFSPFEPVAFLRDPYGAAVDAASPEGIARKAGAVREALAALAQGALAPGWLDCFVATWPEVETLLERLAVPFRTGEDGRRHMEPLLEVPVGADETETVYGLDAGVHSGEALRMALLQQLRRAAVVAFERTMLLELIRREDGAREPCIGVQVLDLDTGHASVLLARSVVLATGGLAVGFDEASFLDAVSASGDGQAALLRAGGELVDPDRFEWVAALSDKPCVVRGPLWGVQPRLVGGDVENDESNAELAAAFADDESRMAKARHAACLPGNTSPLDAALWQAWRAALAAVPSPSHEAQWHADADDAAGRFLDWTVAQRATATLEQEQADATPPRLPVALRLDYGGHSEEAASPLERLRRVAPEVVAWLKEAGYELSEADARLPVTLRVRRQLGGCRVSAPTLSTSVPGVYACGDAAGGLYDAAWPDGFAMAVSLASGLVAGAAAAAHKDRGEPVPSENDLPRRIRRDATRLPTKRPHRRALTGMLAQLASGDDDHDDNDASGVDALEQAETASVDAVATALWNALGTRRADVEMFNAATIQRAVLAAHECRRRSSSTSASGHVRITLPTTARRLPAAKPDAIWQPDQTAST